MFKMRIFHTKDCFVNKSNFFSVTLSLTLQTILLLFIQLRGENQIVSCFGNFSLFITIFKHIEQTQRIFFLRNEQSGVLFLKSAVLNLQISHTFYKK